MGQREDCEMMERRDFFKSIAGLFAVAAIDPASLLKPQARDLLEMARASSLPLSFQTQLHMLTHYMHKELVAVLPGFPEIGDTRGAKLGDEFNKLLGIHFCPEVKDLHQDDEFMRLAYVQPMVRTLEREIRRSQAVRFGKLPHPYGVDISAIISGQGISLRGIRAFDIVNYRFICRFDTLFQGAA